MPDLTEALRLIQETARAAAMPRIIPAPGEPEHCYYLQHGSTLDLVEAKPDPRSSRVDNLADFVEAVAFYDSLQAPKTTVWIGGSGAVAVFCDTVDRRDRVTLPLEYGRAFRILSEWGEAGLDQDGYSQPGLIDLLRTSLAGTFEEQQPDLIPALRRIRLTRRDNGESIVGHGAQELGRKIFAEVACIEGTPETVTFTVPVFTNLDECLGAVEIECAILIDVEKAIFRLLPLGDSIESAERWAIDTLYAAIASDVKLPGVKVFRGQP